MRSDNPSTKLLPIAVAALLVGAVAGCGDCHPGAAPGAGALAPVTMEPLRWDLGTRYTYDLRLQSQANIQAQGGVFDMDLSATLSVAAVSSGTDGAELRLSLDSPRFPTQGLPQEQAARFEALAQELEQPVFALYKDGQLQELLLPESASAFAVGIFRNLAAALQLAPSDKADKPWQVLEYDGTGAYLAEYALEPVTQVLVKQKKEYTELLKDQRDRHAHAQAQEMAPPQVTGSRTSLHLQEGVLQKLESTESLSLPSLLGAPITSQTQLSLLLKNAHPNQDPTALAPPEKGHLRLSKDQAFSQAVSQDVLDAARMDGRTFDQVVQALEALTQNHNYKQLLSQASKEDTADAADKTDQAQKWMGDWMNLFGALPAFFRQQPETIGQAVKKIHQGTSAQEALLGGLSAAGTLASQEALLQIVQHPKTPEDLGESAMVSLIRCKDPQPATAQALTQMMAAEGPYRSHAVFGVGTIARNLREQGQAKKSRDLSDSLVNALNEAKERSEKIDILYGISNSGHKEALEAVYPYLSDPYPNLRVAALTALRLMDRPEADVLLAQAMDSAHEPKRTVREAAIMAAQPRTPSVVLAEALARVALTDESKGARYKAVTLLAQWLPEMPEQARTALEQVAQNEKEPIIQKAAQQALKTRP